MAKDKPANPEKTKNISVNVPLSVWKTAKIKCIETDADLTKYVADLILADCAPKS